jgi:hypothetical protein
LQETAGVDTYTSADRYAGGSNAGATHGYTRARDPLSGAAHSHTGVRDRLSGVTYSYTSTSDSLS